MERLAVDECRGGAADDGRRKGEHHVERLLEAARLSFAGVARRTARRAYWYGAAAAPYYRPYGYPGYCGGVAGGAGLVSLPRGAKNEASARRRVEM
jgi:hypothetical protein